MRKLIDRTHQGSRIFELACPSGLRRIHVAVRV
ncbi:unnamed protein product [Linum tenue]|uniref:Uncharacterized protein n=1 Tax=Linum tenue TaxID=586396 RepID=A0AAV0P4R0_9ROSI|nr:unnamed protein product [Linum tenue]